MTNTPQRLWAGLQVTKTVVDTTPSGVLPGATFGGVWTCTQGGAPPISARFIVVAGGTTPLFTPAEQRVPATAACSVIEDTLATDSLVDGSFDWGEPTYAPATGDVTLVAGETASIGIVNTVVRVYSDVRIQKVITGPAVGARPDHSAVHRHDHLPVRHRRADQHHLVGDHGRRRRCAPGCSSDRCAAPIEDPPGRSGQPVTGDSSYVWRTPIVSGPVTVTPPPAGHAADRRDEPDRPPVRHVQRDKTVTGAVDGIADPTPQYAMNWTCTDGLGNTYSGALDVALTRAGEVGPEQEIPTASNCVLTEPAGELPALIDDAWQWQLPTFTVDGVPAVDDGSSLAFVIPTPQEDQPEPHVAIGVTNSVSRTFGAYTLSKSSDPAPGSVVQPGSVITYTVTMTSTGDVPVHDVVVTDDLAGVLADATVVDGSITAPAGTSAALDLPAQRLVWTVGDVPAGDDACPDVPGADQPRSRRGDDRQPGHRQRRRPGRVPGLRRERGDVVDPGRHQGGRRAADARCRHR